MGGGLHAALGGEVFRDSEGSTGVLNGRDEEGLGLLRQQLSAVKRIRIEHERKDVAIAALRLEVRSGNGRGKNVIYAMTLWISCFCGVTHRTEKYRSHTTVLSVL